MAATKRPYKPKPSMFKKGTADDLDPDHLASVVTTDEATEWLRTLELSRDAKQGGQKTIAMFTQWEREFIDSLLKQAEQKRADGFDAERGLFTGRQLVVIKRLINHCADAAQAALQKDTAP